MTELLPLAMLADVTLGKMVQPARKGSDEEYRPYLRAAHIQANGRLDLSIDLKEMWFTPEEKRSYELLAGDVLLVEGGAVGRSAFLPQALPGIGFQNALLRLRPIAGTDGRYLDYCLQSAVASGEIDALCASVSIAHFTAEKVGRFRVPFSSPENQSAIADYLDRETGEIDAMIAKMDELAETLEIRRKAVVLGVLAELPSRTRLTLILDVVSGSGFPDKYQGLSGEELPFYKVSSLSTAKYGRLGDAGNSVSRDVADELRARIIPSGSVVMAKIGAALLLARYALTTRPACIDNNMQALVPREGSVDSRFLSYAMEEVSVRSLVKPGPVPSLDVMGMKMTDVAYHPSLDEQRRIAEHLDEVTGKIDAMLAKVAELKSLLIERRAALITDVVTGRKKVA